MVLMIKLFLAKLTYRLFKWEWIWVTEEGVAGSKILIRKIRMHGPYPFAKYLGFDVELKKDGQFGEWYRMKWKSIF